MYCVFLFKIAVSPIISIIYERFDFLMFLISKEEAAELRRRCPSVHIVRTMKQKSRRGNYFCEETVAAMRVVKEMRSGEIGVSE